MYQELLQAVSLSRVPGPAPEQENDVTGCEREVRPCLQGLP